MTVAEHRKSLIHKLLKGLESGDPEAARVVDESEYIQHNPQTEEGAVGLAELFARLAKTNPRVNFARTFADGDHVFAHMEYDFSTRRIGFEVFRFEGDRPVEHWDNIQPRRGPSPSGRSMVDGPTEATDPALTETHRQLVRRLLEEVFVARRFDQATCVADDLIQHDPSLPDGWDAWKAELLRDEDGRPHIVYETVHRVLADGSFVLTVTEGSQKGTKTSFYDLFRVQDGRVVEHWNTVEAVPPRAEWKNENGKF
ncbi:MAG: nuclear transport factor 2 family protein [Proteobacteria bacterium]|nr:nuclear transport factor 2 family protein [Pseudomonadota bacterium]